MKCTSCGKEEFYFKSLEGGTDDGWWGSNDVEIAVCINCGHVELKATENLIKQVEVYKENKKAREEANKAIQEKENLISEISHRIDEINKEIKEMEVASINDNILVKEQKEMVNQINVKKKQIHELTSHISSIRREINQIKIDLSRRVK